MGEVPVDVGVDVDIAYLLSGTVLALQLNETILRRILTISNLLY